MGNNQRSYQPKNLILHLGCGTKRIYGTVNVDIQKLSTVDEVVDLASLPWKWESNTVEGIYMHHLLEHFENPKKIIMECYRILKPGGFLDIRVPHSSCVTSIGCIGHYRTYSYDTLRDYLSRPFYMFGKALFKTTAQELRWWYEECSFENVPRWMVPPIKVLNVVINKLIRLSPQVCENFWIYWVGGAKEVFWRGEKI